ncbi:unnamed protein product [Cyclocybe aegerita]|uniref:THO1-MOS11 C-terminal domain-containing protein n=1 Tax=Cyclocybe aegerita TaxID=1973307 RepID=A0A8S0VT10_CYCAE|nr:unnamed protein product [Cyclocybe aegerita]
MDAKLKALKVVDLKHILATATVPAPAKATKSDLITRILASKPAQDAYASLYPPDDLLAPPEEVDWNVDQPETAPAPVPVPAAPASPPKAASVAVPTPAPTATTTTDTTTTVTSATASDIDPELEKRRARAARFGIPLVEPKQPKTQKRTPEAKQPVPAATTVSPEQLAARAARFGITPKDPKAAPQTNDKKRPAETVDPEELERRRKRAERFGFPTKA